MADVCSIIWNSALWKHYEREDDKSEISILLDM